MISVPLKTLLWRWLLPAGSGLLMALALPPFDYGQIAWVSLIPLFFALEGCERGEAFRRGYIAGLVFFGMTTWWTVHVTLPGMVGLVAFLALYFGVAAMWFAELLAPTGNETKPRSDSIFWNLLASVLGAAGWVTLEWVRGNFLFGGFGWNGLGVTQHQMEPLIQFACFTGVYGVSGLLCLLNFTLFFTVRRLIDNATHSTERRRLSYEFYVATILICAALIHGMRTIQGRRSTRVLSLVLVQGNIPQSLKFDPAEKPMILERYRRNTATALIQQPQPDLIIWPETAAPEPVRYDVETFDLVTNLVAKANAPLLTGTIDVTPYPEPSEAFNSAMLIRSDGSLGPVYRKMHLVPFGEYVPWRRYLPFMKWLTPIGENSFERGSEFTKFDLPTARFGVVICFEDTVPDLYRKFVEPDVDFMVNITNDGWFKESPASELQLANAVFRTVETRRPLVRATNNGVTCIVDECGFVRPRLDRFAEGFLNCELHLPAQNETTFYTKHGDVFVGGCGLLSLAGVAWIVLRRKTLN